MMVMISIFFSGCSLLPSSSTPSSAWVNSANARGVTGAVFTLSIPASWESANKHDLPTPRYGTIVGAFVSSDISAWTVENLVILRDDLDTIISSKRYADLNHVQTARNYLEYTFLGQTLLTFDDGDTAGAYTFEARYNETTPRIKYIQTAKVCGRNVYLLNFSLALDRDTAAYMPFLSSFHCR